MLVVVYYCIFLIYQRRNDEAKRCMGGEIKNWLPEALTTN